MPSHGVFDYRKERIAAVAVELVAGGQIDIPGVVEGSAVGEGLSDIVCVVGGDVGDLLALGVDDAEALAFL